VLVGTPNQTDPPKLTAINVQMCHQDTRSIIILLMKFIYNWIAVQMVCEGFIRTLDLQMHCI
jgi:hypothetical protein